jgi:hypothetical protein
MKFIVLVKANKDTEAGVMPSTELLEAMGNYNEELVKAGIMKGGDGLHPTSKGARVKFSGEDRTVIDGPFAESKELIAGYWLWEAGSMQEAIEWAKKCPNPTGALPNALPRKEEAREAPNLALALANPATEAAQLRVHLDQLGRNGKG